MGSEAPSKVMHWPCDLCGADDPRPIDVAREYIGGREPPAVCGGCGFVYVPDRRSSEDIARAWDGVWGEGYTSAWPAVMARLVYVVEWINEEFGLEDQSVLDVGGGEGTFLKYAGRYLRQAMALEPDARNVQNMRVHGIPACHGTIESFETDERYDFVTVLWTLENCGDCIGFLKKARQFVKPDGRIVVATGSRILVPYKKPMRSYFADADQDLHCFRFSATSLMTALFKAGFGDFVFNRYGDSDWLVIAAKPTDNEGQEHIGFQNEPDQVARFFRGWHETFP